MKTAQQKVEEFVIEQGYEVEQFNSDFLAGIVLMLKQQHIDTRHACAKNAANCPQDMSNSDLIETVCAAILNTGRI